MVFARVRFGVLRLGTSPKTSFSNDNLIKQFATRRLAIAENVPCLPPPEKKEIKNKVMQMFPTVIPMFVYPNINTRVTRGC